MKYFLSFFMFPVLVFCQVNYPTDFISPLSIPLDVSGSFGELRSNHFHSGLDLKTNSVEGLDVFAVADGYISRIKISTFGYGKAIYITHPNGYTTVYGHLQKANGAIEEYIKQQQYIQKAFEVEMFLKPSELPVKQGDIIAFSGNSGGSGGPHLHFEFRDTKTEKIINPLNSIIFFSSITPLFAIIVDEVPDSLATEIFCKMFELSCKKIFVILSVPFSQSSSNSIPK